MPTVNEALTALEEAIPAHLRSNRHGDGFLGQRYDTIHAVLSALRSESVSVTLTETDRSDLRVAANIIDRDGPSPIGVELSATLRRIASAGVDVPGEGKK